MNNLSTLNDHLFSQLTCLSNKDMTPEDIEREISRTDAIVSISDQVLNIASTQLRAAKLYADYGEVVLPHLPQIGKAAE